MEAEEVMAEATTPKNQKVCQLCTEDVVFGIDDLRYYKGGVAHEECMEVMGGDDGGGEDDSEPDGDGGEVAAGVGDAELGDPVDTEASPGDAEVGGGEGEAVQHLIDGGTEPYKPTLADAYTEAMEAKRGRGRPKGSKTKNRRFSDKRVRARLTNILGLTLEMVETAVANGEVDLKESVKLSKDLAQTLNAINGSPAAAFKAGVAAGAKTTTAVQSADEKAPPIDIEQALATIRGENNDPLGG